MSAAKEAEISIHAPRVGCDKALPCKPSPRGQISIHAPRVGCDNLLSLLDYTNIKFQSTHPVWGATSSWNEQSVLQCNFNPRTPCGVRHLIVTYI